MYTNNQGCQMWLLYLNVTVLKVHSKKKTSYWEKNVDLVDCFKKRKDKLWIEKFSFKTAVN